MKIDFHEPPPAKKTGGLDQAICSLREYLVRAGFCVQTNSPSNNRTPPQAVHFHGLWQTQFLKVSAQCRRSGVPYVVSPHGMLEPWAWKHKSWKKRPYYYLFEKRHLRHARAVLATSELEAGNLSRFVPRENIVTIPLGLASEHRPDFMAAREKLGWTPDELVLLYLSRLHQKKGLHLLIQAVNGIASLMPERWRLVIVGAGEEKYVSACRQISAANETVFRHTQWKGAVWGEAKWSYLQGADLFCLPSFSENFGLAILEACQVGTRVLTTPYTPWAFLADWQAAILVEPEVESLRQSLKAYLHSRLWLPDDRERLATRTHERFGWQTVGPQYLSLYERLTASSAGSTKPGSC
jgi:glycosyltransferase involved in cell wall biosynthesis